MSIDESEAKTPLCEESEDEKVVLPIAPPPETCPTCGCKKEDEKKAILVCDKQPKIRQKGGQVIVKGDKEIFVGGEQPKIRQKGRQYGDNVIAKGVSDTIVEVYEEEEVLDEDDEKYVVMITKETMVHRKKRKDGDQSSSAETKEVVPESPEEVVETEEVLHEDKEKSVVLCTRQKVVLRRKSQEGVREVSMKEVGTDSVEMKVKTGSGDKEHVESATMKVEDVMLDLALLDRFRKKIQKKSNFVCSTPLVLGKVEGETRTFVATTTDGNPVTLSIKTIRGTGMVELRLKHGSAEEELTIMTKEEAEKEVDLCVEEAVREMVKEESQKRKPKKVEEQEPVKKKKFSDSESSQEQDVAPDSPDKDE